MADEDANLRRIVTARTHRSASVQLAAKSASLSYAAVELGATSLGRHYAEPRDGRPDHGRSSRRGFRQLVGACADQQMLGDGSMQLNQGDSDREEAARPRVGIGSVEGKSTGKQKQARPPSFRRAPDRGPGNPVNCASR
jgi:hypothetical protein